MPELAPDEVLVAVMASSINYNTVWSAMFEPIPTFHFLKQNARQGGWATRHDQPYHVLGSDCSGVVVRTGIGVRRWKPGDHVIVHPGYIDEQEPATQGDGVLGDEAAGLGLRDQLRRPGRVRRRPGQPNAAQARPPDAGRRPQSARCARGPPTGCWSATAAPR